MGVNGSKVSTFHVAALGGEDTPAAAHQECPTVSTFPLDEYPATWAMHLASQLDSPAARAAFASASRWTRDLVLCGMQQPFHLKAQLADTYPQARLDWWSTVLSLAGEVHLDIQSSHPDKPKPTASSRNELSTWNARVLTEFVESLTVTVGCRTPGSTQFHTLTAIRLHRLYFTNPRSILPDVLANICPNLKILELDTCCFYTPSIPPAHPALQQEGEQSALQEQDELAQASAVSTPLEAALPPKWPAGLHTLVLAQVRALPLGVLAAALSQSPSLTSLTLRDLAWPSEMWEELESVKGRLKHLVWDVEPTHPSGHHQLPVWLASLTKLESIEVHKPRFQRAHLAALLSLPKLTHVTLKDVQLEPLTPNEGLWLPENDPVSTPCPWERLTLCGAVSLGALARLPLQGLPCLVVDHIRVVDVDVNGRAAGVAAARNLARVGRCTVPPSAKGRLVISALPASSTCLADAFPVLPLIACRSLQLQSHHAGAMAGVERLAVWLPPGAACTQLRLEHARLPMDQLPTLLPCLEATPLTKVVLNAWPMCGNNGEVKWLGQMCAAATRDWEVEVLATGQGLRKGWQRAVRMAMARSGHDHVRLINSGWAARSLEEEEEEGGVRKRVAGTSGTSSQPPAAWAGCMNWARRRRV